MASLGCATCPGLSPVCPRTLRGTGGLWHHVPVGSADPGWVCSRGNRAPAQERFGAASPGAAELQGGVEELRGSWGLCPTPLPASGAFCEAV